MTKTKNPQLYNSFADKISPLLGNIQNSDKQQLIEKFWKNEVTPYFVYIQEMKEVLEAGNLSYEEASKMSIESTAAVLEKGRELEKKLEDETLAKELKAIFRVVGAPFGLSSDAVRHALEKPGGYPGDHELLEFIYNNVPTSKKLGYCADMVFLEDDYARAVRSRKDWMKKRLTSFLQEHSNKPASILNIACGASRELREIFTEESFNLSEPITFNLIDKSKEALIFSDGHLADIAHNVHFNYINNSVYDYLKDPVTHSKRLSGQDLVYSIGLADYIPADALSDQIKFFYDLLNPGGKLIIAHKDSKNYLPLTPDWWADWTFYLRDEEEVVALVKASGITNYTLTVERESTTNIIFFLNIEKGLT